MGEPSRRLIPLDDGHKAAVLALIREAHGAAVASWHDAVWDWKIKDNPAFRPDQQYHIGLVENDRLVGAIAMMPVRMKIGDSVVAAAIPLDNVVSPLVPHHGIAGAALKIGGEVVRVSPKLIYGAVDERNRKLWRRIFGHEPLIGGFHRRHLALSLAPILSTRFKLPAPLAMAGGAIYRVAVATALQIAYWRWPRDIRVAPVAELNDAFDALWAWAAPSYANIMVRDREFLQWRFERLPNRRFTILRGERSGRTVGYAILRFFEEDGLRKAVIVDLFTHAGEQGIFRALLTAAVAEAQRQGAAMVSMLESGHDGLRREARRLLFLKDKRHVCMIAHSNTFPVEKYCDAAKWWFTLADADLDLVA